MVHTGDVAQVRAGRRLARLVSRRPRAARCLLALACVAGMTTLLTVAGPGERTTSASGAASVGPPTPPPTTSVLIPSNGATVSSSVYLDASAGSPAGVASVVFELTGGALIDHVISPATPTYYGWIGGWNTTSVPNGAYVLQSVATDVDGVSTTSAPIAVTVNNAPPLTTVLIPSKGATQSGSQILDASASASVTKVSFELTGGALIDQVISAATPTYYGWLGSWDTTAVPNGTYAVQSVASYAGGGTGTSAPVTITVLNSSTLRGNGSVDEAWLTGAHPGDRILLMHHGWPVANPSNPNSAGSLGSLVVRNLQPGPGYRWLDVTTDQKSPSFAVLAPGANPPTDAPLYTGQPMHEGLNYITMRDGIQLAATVRYPYGQTCSATSPCPTLVEYSGYNVAGPTDPIPPLIDGILGVPCTNCGNPNLLPDSSTYVGAVVARFSGFATVSLQMRGTGCSGGALDLFGYPSDYDAYDAIEIMAHQSWVANHKVGMVGISFSGLSQFPAAGTDPPGLAAIAPMSPTDDLFSTGYPGGIYNNGFAASWVASRINDAKPAAVYRGGTLVPSSATPISGVGQPWTYYEIDAELAGSPGASSTCLTNQVLHDQSQDLAGLVGPQMVAPGGPGRDPSLFDRRSMTDWAAAVDVPVFVSGALQDEQTGPQWPALIDAIPKSTPVFANMVNGGHIDSADTQTISRWLEFLDIYVANAVPTQPNAIDALALGQFAALAAHVSAAAPLPPLRFANAPDPVTARAEFAAQTPLARVLFDNGAGSAGPGNMQSTYSADFTSWPPAGTVTRFSFGPSGSLQSQAPATPASATFTLDPSTRPSTSLAPGNNAWAANPGWDWRPVPSADGIAFQTAPFTTATTIVGPATLDLWVKATAPVEDFQATITEVRPADSQEEYVTSGFLRSANQDDASNSTALFTNPTYLAADAANLSPERYALVKIPIDPIAHTFRPGTELRVVISAPGGDRPVWTFDTLDNGQQATVGIGGLAASALTVNVVPGVTPTAALPACGAVRGEPCRAYVAEGNQG